MGCILSNGQIFTFSRLNIFVIFEAIAPFIITDISSGRVSPKKHGIVHLGSTSTPPIYLKSGKKCEKNETHPHLVKSFFSFAICLHSFSYIPHSGDVFKWIWITYIQVRSKPLIYLKSGKKCEKTRPIHILRNHFLVLQFVYIVFHTFQTQATCLNGYG